jgi:hypothetical protein
MADTPISAEVERAGRVALADDLYGLRCELAPIQHGDVPMRLGTATPSAAAIRRFRIRLSATAPLSP